MMCIQLSTKVLCAHGSEIPYRWSKRVAPSMLVPLQSDSSPIVSSAAADVVRTPTSTADDSILLVYYM